MTGLDPKTIKTLNGVNLAFYESRALDFSNTRNAEWEGWDRLLQRFQRPVSVLDLGCGNGRFVDALRARNLLGKYVGVDSSEALLDIARRRHPDVTFEQGDVTEIDREAELVVAFGLLHHLPGRTARQRFLQRLRGDTVALTFWQFDGLPRFEKKKRSFSEIGLTDEQVEPGDFLLSWKGDALRYCHHASDEEIRGLAESIGDMQVVDRYSADGGLNLYLVLDRVRRR